jgi:hypothetical protein
MTRLINAVFLFARQEWERKSLGGPDEQDDVDREIEDVADEVLPIIEQSLDEDLLDQLDDTSRLPALPMLHPFSPAAWSDFVSDWFSGAANPFFPWFAGGGRRFERGVTRRHAAIDDVIDDFRSDVHRERRKARRDDRGLAEAEINELIASLRDELSPILKRKPSSSRSRDEKKRKSESSDED